MVVFPTKRGGENMAASNQPEIYNVEALGKPLGQYSHITRVRATEFLFIAGMLSPGEDFNAQCTGVFKQIEQALQSAGAGWPNVVQFTTYLVNSRDIPNFMKWRLREFPRLFGDRAYPPNTLLIIDRLVDEQFMVEVQTIAAL
jgi:enamine deaminase RidA (YjgF/YER057c/UK114 family)